MRVDGSDAGIDNLELYQRKAFSEHHLEVAAESIRRIGVAPGNRLTQYKDPVGSRCLCCGNHVWARCSVYAWREKGCGEKLVVTIRRAALVCAGAHCAGWRSNSANPKHHLRDR